MNIAFDAAAILGPMGKNRGIGNYTLAQFREMISRDKDNQYFFFNVFEPFSLGNYPNLHEEYFDCGKYLGLLNVADGKVYGSLLHKYLQNNKIDVFYITSPFDDKVPAYREEWFTGVKIVATVYDIIPYVFRTRYFPGGESDMGWYMDRVAKLKWMTKMLVISKSVKDDLMNYLNFPGDNIDVIWGAPSAMFQEITVGKADAELLKKKYRLKDRFVMCTGGDDDRKNIAGLIEAYGKLPHELKEQYGLVIVCKLQNASVQRYTALAKEFGVKNEVVFTNYVSDEELIQLYNMASLIAFPSKYEGFGLPVVEAWACGKPVLTSNNSSLIQIAGDAAAVVDADSVEDISHVLQETLREDVLKQLAEKGRERLKLFQWPAVADRAIAAINQLKPEKTVETELPRLAYFTPLPPQKSGIADYSEDIIRELACNFQIDVFIDDGYRPVSDFPQNVRILNHESFPVMAQKYQYILYQMGNSTFHYYMYPYLRQYGGVLVLHDYNMHDTGQWATLHLVNDNMKTYRDYLTEDFPEPIVDEYLQCIRMGGPVDISMELNGFVTNYASKIIVHSSYAMEKLLRKDIRRTVRMIPLYAKIAPLENTADVKKRYNISPKVTVFATFGRVHEAKRAIPVLMAGIEILKEYKDAILLFVGELDKGIYDTFHQILAKSGVRDRIRVTGYIKLEQFCDYIDATDVCLNLRYPYNGENSASLARILARGRCVVVNNIGSFTEIPDGCCVKLPPVEEMRHGQEEKMIYNVMKQLMEDSELRNKIGQRARKYAESTLNIRIVAEQYSAFIKQEIVNELNEEVVSVIQRDEILKKGYTDDEIRGISRTLAYCAE